MNYPFNVGDRVVCTQDALSTHLLAGRVYIVSERMPSNNSASGLVRVRGIGVGDRAYFAHRFTRHQEAPARATPPPSAARATLGVVKTIDRTVEVSYADLADALGLPGERIIGIVRPGGTIGVAPQSVRFMLEPTK